MERAIHEQLAPVHTTARRRRTEWFWNDKEGVVDAFLKAMHNFAKGLLVNPAFHFSLPDLSAQEKARNSKAKEELAQLARAQAAFIRKKHPRDYSFLCSCKHWEADPDQVFHCPK